MNLIVKQIIKKVRKVDSMESTIYTCVLEGSEFRQGVGVKGKLSLESENPEALKEIVRQAIDVLDEFLEITQSLGL